MHTLHSRDTRQCSVDGLSPASLQLFGLDDPYWKEWWLVVHWLSFSSYTSFKHPRNLEGIMHSSRLHSSAGQGTVGPVTRKIRAHSNSACMYAVHRFTRCAFSSTFAPTLDPCLAVWARGMSMSSWLCGAGVAVSPKCHDSGSAALWQVKPAWLPEGAQQQGTVTT